MGEDARKPVRPRALKRLLHGGVLLAAGGVAAALLLSTAATAKSDFTSRYGYDKTWNSALRLVRVDLGYKVLEKDEKTGYLMFEYRSPESGPKPSSGSLELVRSGPSDVKVVAQIPQMPRYHETALLDGLAKKMHDDYGDAPAPRREEPAPPALADAGTDAPEDDYDRDPSEDNPTN